MLLNRRAVNKNWSRAPLLVAGILMILLFAACAGGNYGKIVRDRDLDNMFLSYQVLPDHNYYTTGSYDNPSAILALKNNYELVNTGNLWVPVPNVNQAQMRKWIETIDPNENYRYTGNYFAAYILNPNGEKIGAWFAIQNTTTVKFLGDNKVQVYTPDVRPEFQNNNRGLMFRGGR